MTQAPATPELVEGLKAAAIDGWSYDVRLLEPEIAAAVAAAHYADALEAQQARIAELEKALRPFERAFRTLDTRFDDETKIMITLPTTKRVRPTTYVYVEDVLRLRQALSSQGRHEGVTSGSIPELPGVNAVPLPASPDGPLSDGTPMPADFVDEVRARLTMIADDEQLRRRTTHFLGEVRSMDHIVRVAARCFGRPTLRVGDREGHSTERPQASPQPRDEPLPSPNHTNPEAEHG